MPDGNNPSRKEQTRERILRAAARAIRRHGYEGVGVAEVMKDAGLTHGGFYAHFDSRDALLAAAADQAGAESIESLNRALAAREARRGADGAGRRRISPTATSTRPSRGWAARIAAAGSERAAPACRSAARRQPAHQGPHRSHRAPVPRLGQGRSAREGHGHRREHWSARCCSRARWTIRSFRKPSARPRASSSAARRLIFCRSI